MKKTWLLLIAPVVSFCGPDAYVEKKVSTDYQGIVHRSKSSMGCMVSFSSAWENYPTCAYSYDDGALTFPVHGSSTNVYFPPPKKSSGMIHYLCVTTK